MDKVQEKPYSEIELDFSLDNNGKYILSYKTVIAELLTLLLPEEFFDMDLNEIADKYIPSSDANPDRVKLEKEEVDTVEGKKTVLDLHFHINSPSGKKYTINIELQKNKSDLIRIRSYVYTSKLLAEQKHSNYKDFSPVISGWINLDPYAAKRNKIIVTKPKAYELIKNKNTFTYQPIDDEESSLGFQKIVEINVGGPEYDNFTEDIKFFYDLFNNNVDGVKKFYNKRNTEFNEEIFKPMREYTTLDQQAKELYKEEARQEMINFIEQNKHKSGEEIIELWKNRPIIESNS